MLLEAIGGKLEVSKCIANYPRRDRYMTLPALCI